MIMESATFLQSSVIFYQGIVSVRMGFSTPILIVLFYCILVVLICVWCLSILIPKLNLCVCSFTRDALSNPKMEHTENKTECTTYR